MSQVHYVVCLRGIPLCFCSDSKAASQKAQYFGGCYEAVKGPLPIDVGAASREYMEKRKLQTEFMSQTVWFEEDEAETTFASGEFERVSG